MAKGYKHFRSAVDGYRSKGRDRKRRGADIGSILSSSAKLVASAIPVSTKKKQKKRSSKPGVATSKKEAIKDKNVISEEEAQFGGCVVLVLICLIVLAVLYFLIGIKGILLLAGIVLVVFFVSVIRETKKRPSTRQLHSEEIEELKRRLANIDVYKDVANNSTDAYSVQCAMNELLSSIDYIMQYEEDELHQAGLSKSKLPEQRDFIVRNYDIMIEQAHERLLESTAKHTNTTNFSESSTVSVDSENASVISCTSNNIDSPSLDDRLKLATQSAQGLFPHEILMLSYAHTYKSSGNSFQGFWQYQYSVEDPQSVLDSLHKRGFITLGDIKATISRLKVLEIKSELQAIGEKTTGKKYELVDRLISNADSTGIEQKYSDRYFVLTDKGRQELEKNEYVSYLHKTKYISVWDMNYLLHHNNPSCLTYRDILWREFNTQCSNHFKSRDFGLYRNTRMHMYQFLMEEGKHQEAFLMLCEVVAYDLSGLGNNEIIDDNPNTRKTVLENIIKFGFPYSNSLYRIPPAVVGWLIEIRELLSLSESDFRRALLDNFNNIHLFRRIFTNEECVEIVLNEIDNHPRKQATLYKQAEDRLRRELNTLK